jgi:hypothetical protein
MSEVLDLISQWSSIYIPLEVFYSAAFSPTQERNVVRAKRELEESYEEKLMVYGSGLEIMSRSQELSEIEKEILLTFLDNVEENLDSLDNGDILNGN